MDNVKNNRYYLSKIVTDAQFMIDHTQDITPTELEKNEVLVDSIMFRLVQIYENSAHLTDEFKRQHAAIDWRSINGLRNRIVHDYGRVDLRIIFDTVKNDIPALRDYLINLI